MRSVGTTIWAPSQGSPAAHHGQAAPITPTSSSCAELWKVQPFSSSTSLDGPALCRGQHCSHSPSPGRKSLVIYFIFYMQADVRTADHARQVRRAQGLSKLLYPQPKSISTPQKPQVSRGQRWPDASCVRICRVERARLLVPSNTWLSALLDEGHNNQERKTRQRWWRREG